MKIEAISIPTIYYVICIITILITVYAVFRQLYLIGVKRVPFIKTWRLFLTWFIFLTPATLLYEIIAQLDVYPKHVKTVKLDLTHSTFESDLIGDIIKEAKADNGTCESNVCTMKVLGFQHNRNEVIMRVSNESDGEIYCGVCASPIHFDFGRMELVAHVIFR